MCQCGSKLTIQYDNGHFCSLCLKRQEIKKFSYKWLYFIFTFIMCIWLVIPSISEKNSFIVGKYNLYKNSCNDIQLNDSCIIKELIAQNFQFPEVALAKIKVECGRNYNSRVCLEQHNLFGYGWNGKTYHTYKTYKESIKAYKHWETKYLKEHSKIYAESKNYSDLLTKMH